MIRKDQGNIHGASEIHVIGNGVDIENFEDLEGKPLDDEYINIIKWHVDHGHRVQW